MQRLLKGGELALSEKEKAIIKRIAEAFKRMPDGRREYLLGFAEGVLHATSEREQQEPNDSAEREVSA